jgi:FtsH-binding integral membrane protein
MPGLTGYRNEGMFGSVETVGTAGVFGQVMGLVAVTLCFFTLGSYLGREIAEGASIVCFIGGFVCIIGLNVARRSEGLSITLLFGAGLLLGLGMGGVLNRYAEAEPDAVWQAAAATALFVGGLGSVGYAIRRNLSSFYRVLFFALLALIVFGLVTVFVSIPGGNVIYALLGLGIFGAYTVLDFNRMRRAGMSEAVPLAAGIFLDVVNIFLFFLRLFGPCPRQESNLDLPLRRRPSYPLDYEGASRPRMPRPSEGYRRPATGLAAASPASRSSSSPTSRCVIHSFIVCAPIRR